MEREIRRYSAYYFGWCQAFGEHDAFEGDEEHHTQWLVGEQSVGMILPGRVRRTFLRDLLDSKDGEATVELNAGAQQMRVNRSQYDVTSENSVGLQRLHDLISSPGEVHLFLTHHIYYPAGTRIITFSHVKPLIIMYKEVAALTLRML